MLYLTQSVWLASSISFTLNAKVMISLLILWYSSFWIYGWRSNFLQLVLESFELRFPVRWVILLRFDITCQSAIGDIKFLIDKWIVFVFITVTLIVSWVGQYECEIGSLTVLKYMRVLHTRTPSIVLMLVLLLRI
jgi:hypothetical protein